MVEVLGLIDDYVFDIMDKAKETYCLKRPVRKTRMIRSGVVSEFNTMREMTNSLSAKPCCHRVLGKNRTFYPNGRIFVLIFLEFCYNYQ